MIKLAICDDEEAFLNTIEEMIDIYARENYVEVSVSRFPTALALLEALEQDFHIFLLDIQMPLMNGMEIAKIIRNRDEYAYIVFITSTEKYVFEGYQVGASNYIKKPLNYQLFSMEMGKGVEYFNKHNNKYIFVDTKEGISKIYLSSISYIETYNRSTLIHAEGAEIVSNKKMYEYEGDLKEFPFFRCHSSYMINLDYIRSLKKFELILLTGEVIPISKQRKRLLVEECASYLGSGSL